ncbi:MAG TPA: single-stranded DNA-binding protein [Gammaproteobacteria bacterium]|nr:single-stranded DNA-binding protein [Gammaproteobacteria bacterium]HVY53380.1 single-stranded DNA-binding protein [Gammaproteobacteria bacterium]
MTSLNQVMLIGNLGKAPEVLKASKSGVFVRISLATTKKYTNDKGEAQQATQWHTVYFSNKLGKIAADHLSKGATVYVSGELRHSEWQDKDNQKRFSSAVFATDLKFLSKKVTEKTESTEDFSQTIETADSEPSVKSLLHYLQSALQQQPAQNCA